MSYNIHTSIEINAEPTTVWSILTDFDSYGDWNPFIHSITGDVKKGGRIRAHIQNMKFKPRVLAFQPHREFRWKGRLLLPGIFDGTHSFELIPTKNGGTTFVHSESFRGILVPLMKKKLRTDITDDFNAMNRALKKKVEAISTH